MPVQDIAEAIGRGPKVPVVSKSPEEAAASEQNQSLGLSNRQRSQKDLIDQRENGRIRADTQG